MDRREAEAMDADDPLAPYLDRFVVGDPDLVYMDGNSLGRLPKATVQRLRGVVEDEWGGGLVRSWDTWMDLPKRVGDQLATDILGARPGEVALADSTTVNLYKLAHATLSTAPAGRNVIVTNTDNFPTDRYVFEGLGPVRYVAGEAPTPDEIGAALDPGDVAVVSLSHVAYRSGSLLDMEAITEVAHRHGALTLWDLSHSAGAVEIQLDDCQVDLATGCTYKYLNGGPGSPAYLFVRADLQEHLRQPIPGWFGAADQFEMGPRYRPGEGILRFLSGTPPILAVAAAQEGVALVAEVGVARLRAKGIAMTELAIALFDEWLAPLGAELATPRDPARRGSHVSVRHADARAICRTLIDDHNVVPDFRTPDIVRLGPAPLTTRFVEVWEAMRSLREVVTNRK